MTHPLTIAAQRRFETITITAPDLATLKRAVSDAIETRADELQSVTITTATAATVVFTRIEE